MERHFVQTEVNQALGQFRWNLHFGYVNDRGSGDNGGSRFQFCSDFLAIAGRESRVQRQRSGAMADGKSIIYMHPAIEFSSNTLHAYNTLMRLRYIS